ncbi:MAG: ankyrin repeat domain-containing protein [Isosphaeraceae bacterium]|nr:ankyrin repeat domain-containing protein [Isosphaeraceae bacterium]
MKARLLLLGSALWAMACGLPVGEASPPRVGSGRTSHESPHARPIAVQGGRVFVANTPAGTLDVIDADSRRVAARVPVGVDPVGLAIRPDGKELWVSNHVSDSVSVIDLDPARPTHLSVIATIQDLDPKSKSTRFDEPVGIAFANDAKAYVALSSENRIAVIDVRSRKVTKHLIIPAQEPRAIAVRGGRLHVVAFESNNRTQLSGDAKDRIDGELATFDAYAHSITNNNVLSLGHVVDIVKHPRVPDKDLFVFDTRDEEPLGAVEGLGTLLYGLAVDSRGTVLVAQADARNDVNGRSGTRRHGLKELENRAFLNRITRVDFPDGRASTPRFLELEPLPPRDPEKSRAAATPYAVEVTPDDATLVVAAAASDRLFTISAESGEIRGAVDLGAGPRGLALDGSRVWVLEALSNSVALVDLSNLDAPKVVATIPLEDPTDPVFKRGRIAFNTARASTSATYSCASCHPDGHTDQLLWVLDTPIVSGGDQIMPRSTMPARGLRDTEPYHWDGIPGDPYGGNNSASVHASVAPNSKRGDPLSSTRHLIDGGLASTMRRVGDPKTNEEGKLGELTARERDDMAAYLLGVPYPPAPRRSYTDELSSRALDGFRLFHIDGDHDTKQATPNLCGNCHRMPFLTSTNTPGTGMDAPTWRGAQDRWLILPQGRLNIVAFDFYRSIAERGASEREIWRLSWAGRPRFDPVWDMVLEMSTGYSGAYARQATLDAKTARDRSTGDLIDALERAAREGSTSLECDGVLVEGGKARRLALRFSVESEQGRYVGRETSDSPFTREQLVELAAAGSLVATWTARAGDRATADQPQPALWTRGPIERQRGRQDFPIIHPGRKTMPLSGRHFDESADLFVDGRRVSGRVRRLADAEDEAVEVELDALPSTGIHLLQIRVPQGLFSNEFLFHVAPDEAAAASLRRNLVRAATTPWNGLAGMIARGDLAAVKRRVSSKAAAEKREADGSTLLGLAVLHGSREIAAYLLELGVDPSATNRDGNTPLHIAAFLCRDEIVRLLLDRGASTSIENRRGETPVEVVSGPWSDGLRAFYAAVADGSGIELDLERMRADRPKMRELLETGEVRPR